MRRLQALQLACRNLLSRSAAFVARPGIVARLIVAFLAVGVLVFAANFLVVQAVLIERSTTVYQTIAPGEGKSRTSSHPAVPVLPVQRVDTAILRAALIRYRAAVRGRIESNTDRAEGEQLAAAQELQHALSILSPAAAEIGRAADVERIRSLLSGYEADAAAAITAADERRADIRRYDSLADELYALTKQSVDRSWKVFGLVIARHSLLDYSAALDDLRRIATPEDLRGVEEPESRAQHLLIANESAFRRSLGAAWYTTQRKQLDQLVSLREKSASLTSELAGLNEHNLELGENLASSVPDVLRGSLPRAAVAVAAAPAQDPPPTIAPVVPAVSAPVTTQSVTYEDDHDRQRLIALISGGVLLLLIIIGVGTVLSIERPVRRLLAATARIARGETAVRVERGGIRELDTLAVAFNQMADELQQARSVALEYQQSLELKVAERTSELKNFAENDYLTALPNRRRFFAMLNDALLKAGHARRLLGVLFLDVDNFKYINDSLGHAFGDRVLLSLANRLQHTVQPVGIAARFGGDEFTVLVDGVHSVDEIRAVGEQIVKAFQAPLSIDGRDLIVGVSVGASIYPEHEREAETLLRAADAALFRAKKLGRSQLAVFTSDLLETAASNFTTEQGLRRAIERGEFELVFQPEVDSSSFETIVVEALIRWRTHDGRLMSPADFLSVAEEAGLIVEISDWVLGRAVQTAARWYHGSWPEVRVAVNISPRQLLDRGFASRLQRLLQEAQLPARCIEIELTESVLQTGPTTLDALRQLQAQGISIALDDFGTGYSSLSSLQQLPLSRVKLDRSLIADMDANARSRSMVRAIIGMCRQLGLEITAEGVERFEQFALLAGQKIYVQGFLLSPPVAEEELAGARERIASRAEEFLITSRTGTHPVVHELSASRRTRVLNDR
ncbi:MAG TPA: EAL domain-containing protein [Steroidobacteraceae bacterium]|nr:EAL domain-containing protein [Steroidobacteraceae bacterium]